MTRGFLSGTSANRRPVSQPRLRDIAGASRRRSRYVLTWALAAFCWTSGTGWAQGQMGSGTAPQEGAPSMSTGSSEAAGQATTAGAMPIAGASMLYPGEDFKLGPGDLISVRVFLEPDYQVTARLDAEGNVLLPFIGSVNVKGLTVREAQFLIADRLRTGQFYRNPEVTIQVLDTVNGSVIITGEIHGIVPVATERSLREVLLLAGGLPATASHTIKIVRKKADGADEVIVVDLGTDLASSTTANIPVLPHDIIQVMRASVVYVLGAFSHQGAVPLDQAAPLTLLQLVSLSGGIGFEGRFDDLRLIRTVGTERKLVEVDVKKVRDGKAPDPVLQANDIVFLPTSAMKAMLKSLGTGGVLGLVSVLVAIHSL